LENEYFNIFEEIMRKNFNFELAGFGNLSTICPASLLNAFTANMRSRGSDFYENGSEYKIFCPQYTGLANLANSLYNIKTLVYDKKVTTLEEIRNVLLVNWGDELQEPFVPRTLPNIMRTRLKERCDMLREVVWRQNKFGINKDTSEFGLKISRRLCEITRDIFTHPNNQMLSLFKNLTHTYGSAEHPFGFQYLPGCGTFENFEDFGTDRGASFDGRKKAQTLAQDYSPQNFLIDLPIGTPKFEWNNSRLEEVLYNYTYAPLGPNDPLLSSGAVLDFNIDESYPEEKLTFAVDRFAKGYGPNLITITVCSRQKIEEARTNTDRDLLRFRMGGWTEFAVAMFPSLLEQHIRRRRSVPAI
jgi:pyruvate-formate lyase